VLLDAVGTLIEPRPSVAEAYAAEARRQGVELDVSLVKRRFRKHIGDDEVDEIRGPMATDEAAESRRWRRIVAGCLPEVPDPERAFAELWEHFGRASSWRAFPDAGPALSRLADGGLPVRVASNFDGRLRGVLRGLPELARWSEAVVISSEVGRRKPHPEFYRAACGSLGLPPSAVLSVGDDPENDVEGARRAGLRSLLLDRGGRVEGHEPCIRSLGEIESHLVYL
jgi:putative hydrolase of the HAD superfamily